MTDAAAAMPGRLTASAYNAWREAQSGGDASERSKIPDWKTIHNRFGSWRAAVDLMQQRRHDQ
jgi:hypothetical protein